jgi:triosephosphate isomerase
MKNKKIVIGNWKMNPLTPKEAEKLFHKIAKSISRIKKTEIIICPPFVYLEKLKKISRKIKLGAQNAFIGDVGVFTGEVSGEMLYNLGVRYVILGHSERRARGETGGEINKKLKSALGASLTPILCVGENSRDDNHEYFNVVKSQILECLNGIKKNTISKIIFAYEPVWAISSTPSRRDATPEDAREMAVFIRKTISDIAGPQVANQARVIYGGSVTEKDVGDFLQSGGVDGVLVGKASLNVEKFVKIIKIVESSV